MGRLDMDEIRAQCDRIHNAVEMMELEIGHVLDDLGADEYRILLGEVDGASLRVYQFRKEILTIARLEASTIRRSLHVVGKEEVTPNG